MAPTPPTPPGLPPPPKPLPAACANCIATLTLAAAGSVPAQIAYKLARSISGAIRIDYAVTSVIINPALGTALLLDHVKKEVLQILLPAVAAAAIPAVAIPGMPPPPAAAVAALAAIDLGIKIVQGIEVQGKRYTLPPIAPPPPPPLPGMPAVVAALPMIAEVWVSTKLLMPVLSRITGSFGQQMCHCTNTVPGEPPPTAFQVPADYKQIGVPPPPAVPPPPGAPAPPAMPPIPRSPAVPAAPAMPGAPAPPAAPAAPAIPAAPKPPKFSF